jgi:hypothetical protein
METEIILFNRKMYKMLYGKYNNHLGKVDPVTN